MTTAIDEIVDAVAATLRQSLMRVTRPELIQTMDELARKRHEMEQANTALNAFRIPEPHNPAWQQARRAYDTAAREWEIAGRRYADQTHAITLAFDQWQRESSPASFMALFAAVFEQTASIAPQVPIDPDAPVTGRTVRLPALPPDNIISINWYQLRDVARQFNKWLESLHSADHRLKDLDLRLTVDRLLRLTLATRPTTEYGTMFGLTRKEATLIANHIDAVIMATANDSVRAALGDVREAVAPFRTV